MKSGAMCSVTDDTWNQTFLWCMCPADPHVVLSGHVPVGGCHSYGAVCITEIPWTGYDSHCDLHTITVLPMCRFRKSLWWTVRPITHSSMWSAALISWHLVSLWIWIMDLQVQAPIWQSPCSLHILPILHREHQNRFSDSTSWKNKSEAISIWRTVIYAGQGPEASRLVCTDTGSDFSIQTGMGGQDNDIIPSTILTWGESFIAARSCFRYIPPASSWPTIVQVIPPFQLTFRNHWGWQRSDNGLFQ